MIVLHELKPDAIRLKDAFLEDFKKPAAFIWMYARLNNHDVA
jgi:hypothetical protein